MLKRIVPLAVLAFLIFPLLARADDAANTPDALQARLERYQKLVESDAPGSAWFRHQIEETRKQLGQKAPDDLVAQPHPRRNGDLAESFGLFSGTRALSENLQLDRQLRVNPKSDQPLVDLSKIEGITIKEYDWTQKIKGLHPRLDPLARIIPADQHAVFFPSFTSAAELVDEADSMGSPLFEFFDQRSEDGQSKSKYQRQLCLSLTGLGRMLGPRVINSVAVTGSDPYLRTGSDVAILFEPKDAATLQGLLQTQIGMAQKLIPAAKSVEGQIDGVRYTGAISPNRAVCSYLATVGDAVVVTNSLQQLQRLVLAQQGKTPTLAAQPEYIFFRDRYKLGEGDETALIILTDATIRRWCSPRWRIADSRRTRAAAILSDYQAKFADDIVAGDVFPTPIPADRDDLGELQLTPSGVRSSLYGSLEFMTPIIELPMDKVTTAEAAAYSDWRGQYQNYWNRYFDPIAIRLSVKPEKLAADMTVMPLIARSDYAQFVQFSAGAKLDPLVGDPHDSLAHIEVALNPKSDGMQRAVPEAQSKLLESVTGAIGVYLDDDADYWKTFPAKPNPELELQNMPLAPRVELTDHPDKPGLINLIGILFNDPGETKLHNGHPYVKTGSNGMKLPAYYAFTDHALILSLNEKVLLQALDRDADPAKAAGAARPWLGQNLAVTLNANLLRKLLPAMRANVETQMQTRSWSNLPILNEWKRLYPSQDPIQVHQRLWGTILLDPAGGKYVWNEKAKTMESTLFGHPGEPKMPPGLPPVLQTFDSAQFGLDFEESGLRARAVINRTAAAADR